MNIYKISQGVNNDYDTYDSAIVCAENEEEAKKIHPRGEYDYKEKNDDIKEEENYGSWAKKEFVEVEYIGVAKEGLEKGVIVASFNAG